VDQLLLSSRNRAHALLSQQSDVVSKALLKKRAAAIALNDEIKSDARAKADRIYNDKMSSASMAHDGAVNAARRARDEGTDIASKRYEEGVKAPDAIFQTIQAAAKKTLEYRRFDCETVCEYEKVLARTTYDLELKDFSTDEDRDQVRLAFETTIKAVDEKCKNDCRLAELAFKSAECAANDELTRATKSFLDAWVELKQEHEKALRLAKQAALQGFGAALNDASEERERSYIEAGSAHYRQLLLIQSEFSAARKLQMAALAAGRIVVNAYFEYQSVVAPQNPKVAE
jgi:hypothetical protein